MSGSDILTDLQDDDILVIYRDTKGPGRRKSSRIAWGTVKSVVLSAQPTVKGQPGDDGDPGLSAYQLAVASGFTGTLAQWLASLQGAPGNVATVEVGAVKALAAGSAPTVKNTGTASKATLEFGIPAGAAGKDGTTIPPTRVTATTDSTGVATVVWPKPFAAIPDVDVIEGWSGDQMVTGAVVAGTLTTTGCKVQVMLSRATLLLSSGPFQKAGAGVSVTVRAFGLPA